MKEETRAERDIRIARASRGMVGRSDVQRFIRTVDRICVEFGGFTSEQVNNMPFEERHDIWMTYITVYNRQQSQRRRAQMRDSTNHFSPEDIRNLLLHQEGRCAYCRQSFESDWHIEHVVPLSRGGSNGPENVVLACADCNLNKGARTLQEWTHRWYLTEVEITDIKFTGLLWKWVFFDGTDEDASDFEKHRTGY